MSPRACGCGRVLATWRYSGAWAHMVHDSAESSPCTAWCRRSQSYVACLGATSPGALMQKHTILYLAANPSGSDPLALDREAKAIQVELERSRHGDCFELVTRWAAEPRDL